MVTSEHKSTTEGATFDKQRGLGTSASRGKNRYHVVATNRHAVVSVVVEKASIRRRSRVACVVMKNYALAWSWKKLRRIDVKA